MAAKKPCRCLVCRWARTHRLVGIDDGQTLRAFLRDEASAIVAGAAGHTRAGTCELRQVWVAPALRGRGVGRDRLA